MELDRERRQGFHSFPEQSGKKSAAGRLSDMRELTPRFARKRKRLAWVESESSDEEEGSTIATASDESIHATPTMAERASKRKKDGRRIGKTSK